MRKLYKNHDNKTNKRKFTENNSNWREIIITQKEE